MTTKSLRKKVVIYCIDDQNRLLVFRHIDYSYEQVGIEVPAGTVEPGEDIQTAALRELCEETNHHCFKIDTYLGNTLYDISPLRPEIHERHFFRARPTEKLPERWESFETHEGLKTPTRFECFWIPLKQAQILSVGQGAMLWRLAAES